MVPGAKAKRNAQGLDGSMGFGRVFSGRRDAKGQTGAPTSKWCSASEPLPSWRYKKARGRQQNRKIYVHDHHGGLEPRCKENRLLSVDGFSDDTEVVIALDYSRRIKANQAVAWHVLTCHHYANTGRLTIELDHSTGGIILSALPSSSFRSPTGGPYEIHAK